MDDFKARFYDQYQSAHVAPRKGEATLAQFRARVPIFDRHWSRLLPSDPQAAMLDVGCGSGGGVGEPAREIGVGRKCLIQ